MRRPLGRTGRTVPTSYLPVAALAAARGRNASARYGMSTLSGDTLGWAGPTYFRNDGSKYSNTPVAAVMMFVSV
jgi:hypothetical protein